MACGRIDPTPRENRYQLRRKSKPLVLSASGDRLQPAEANRKETPNSCLTVSILVDNREPLHLFRTQGHHQAPTRLELVKQSGRRHVSRSRHQDFVEGGALKPSTGSISHADLDLGVAELAQEILRKASKFLNNLDAQDLTRELRQDRRLISQPGPHLEHLLAGL